MEKRPGIALQVRQEKKSQSRDDGVLSRFSCVRLCDPMDCSLPGSSIHGILQARTLEWVALPSSRGSSQPRDRTRIFCIAGSLYHLSHQGSPEGPGEPVPGPAGPAQFIELRHNVQKGLGPGGPPFPGQGPPQRPRFYPVTEDSHRLAPEGLRGYLLTPVKTSGHKGFL